MKAAILSFLVLFLLGCRKFNHSQVVPTSCALCAYADQLEGTYYGEAKGYNVAGTTGFYFDSLRVTVEHIYRSEGAYIDSTIMFLRLTSVYNSHPETEYVREIEMHGPDNFTYYTSSGYDGPKSFTLTPEKLFIHKESYGMAGQLYVAMDYTGLRE